MTRLSITLLLVLLTLTSRAQISVGERHLTDSLLAVAHSDFHDTIRADAFIAIADILYASAPDSVLKYSGLGISFIDAKLLEEPNNAVVDKFLNTKTAAFTNIAYIHLMKGETEAALTNYDKSKEILDITKDSAGFSSYYLAKGYIYYNAGEPEKALEQYNLSLNYFDDTDYGKGAKSSCLLNMGALYDDMGDIPAAVDYYLLSLALKEEINDEVGMGNIHYNLGYLFENQGDTSSAFSHFDESRKIHLKLNNNRGLAYDLTSLAALNLNAGDTAAAEQLYHEALGLRRKVEDRQGIAHSLNNLGEIRMLQGKLVASKNLFEESLALFRELDDPKGTSFTLNSLAELSFQLSDLQKARKYADESMRISQELKYPDNIKKAAYLLSKIYKDQGKYKLGWEMFELFVEMKDSTRNVDNERNALERNLDYEFDKKTFADSVLNAQNEAVIRLEHQKESDIQQEKIRGDRIIKTSLIAGLILIVLFAFFIFNRFLITKRQKVIISEQKEEVEEQRDIVTQKNIEITDSITYAKKIQTAILPPFKMFKAKFSDAFIIYEPKDIVAGDFYWMETHGDSLMFAAADCTGHGVPGAMVSVICNLGLNRSVREYNLTDPGDILNKTRELVVKQFEKSEEDVYDGMDIALCTLQGKTLRFAGAFNPLWLVRDGELFEYDGARQPVANYRIEAPFKSVTIQLQSKDLLYIFSDGYADQFGGDKGKKFMSGRFKKLLLSLAEQPMEEQKRFLQNTFDEWKGDMEQIDDVCVIGVRV